MTITVKRKVLALAVGAATLPVLVMLGLTMQFQRSVARKAEAELRAMARQNLDQVARDVYRLCDITNSLLQERMSRNLRAAQQIVNRVRLEEGRASTEWDAVNQENQQGKRLALPKLMAGGVWLGKNSNPAFPTLIVDEVKRATSVDATVFQRMNEQGDMLRVATTVLAVGGDRAIATYIPAMLPDGTPNPVIASILKRETYVGPAPVMGVPYVAAYAPISDSRGRVFSMIFVGERLRNVAAIREAILNIVIGKSGHVVVIGAKGAQRGHYIISYQGKRDGEDLYDSQDSQGNFFVREMVHNALTLPKAQVFSIDYPWRDAPNAAPRRKLAEMIYFEPWDWLINAGAYDDEYYAAARTVESATYGLLGKLSLAGAAALALALVCAVLLSSKLAKPIGVTAGVAKRIASGNLVGARQELAGFRDGGAENGKARLFDDRDETTALLGAFRAMADNLDGLIGQVQRSGIQVNSSSTQIAASAREMEGTVAEQASSLREVAATSKEISATSTQLLATMGDVAQAVVDAGEKAAAGQGDLNRMEAAMQQLLKATGSVSSRLGVISDRAGKISSVVTAINKISDQTGLLALNAAIEAEKAGEYGKGFSVVAREISRLSDQTAAATEEIASVIREMQSSVSGGVMEMDRFSEEVRRRVEEVATVSRQLRAIIDQTQTLGPQFESVNSGMQAQTEGARQISQVMGQLAEAAERTRASVQEFKEAAAQLHNAVQSLQTEVARFKISA